MFLFSRSVSSSDSVSEPATAAVAMDVSVRDNDSARLFDVDFVSVSESGNDSASETDLRLVVLTASDRDNDSVRLFDVDFVSVSEVVVIQLVRRM